MKILKNKFFNLIMKVLGLELGKGGFEPNYYNIVIATDADTDGFHIASLLINLFSTYWS